MRISNGVRKRRCTATTRARTITTGLVPHCNTAHHSSRQHAAHHITLHQTAHHTTHLSTLHSTGAQHTILLHCCCAHHSTLHHTAALHSTAGELCWSSTHIALLVNRAGVAGELCWCWWRAFQWPGWNFSDNQCRSFDLREQAQTYFTNRLDVTVLVELTSWTVLTAPH